MLPFDFTIEGPPVSLQAKAQTRAAWKRSLQTAARARISAGALPVADEMRLEITYYYFGSVPDIDLDNAIKPIQDALIGLVYEDDRQVSGVSCHRRSVTSSFRISAAEPVVLTALGARRDFLHIRVLEDP